AIAGRAAGRGHRGGAGELPGRAVRRRAGRNHRDTRRGRSRTATDDKLVADPLVESLLLVHDLHPLDTSARVRRAVEEVLPQLGSHAGNVEYLGLDEAGVLRLRLEQSGCSAETVRDLIEKAVAGAAPEAAGVAIEMAQPPAEPTLLQITRRPAGIQGAR